MNMHVDQYLVFIYELRLCFRLTNLRNLNRKNRRHIYPSKTKTDDNVKIEIVEPKKKHKLSLKKLNSKNLEQYLTDDEDSSSEDLSFAAFKSQLQEKEMCFQTRDEIAKKLLLASQSSEDGTIFVVYLLNRSSKIIDLTCSMSFLWGTPKPGNCEPSLPSPR